MKIVFMGTPEFACPALTALASSTHDVQLVITGRDSRARRGGNSVATPVAVTAESLRLPVLKIDSLRSTELEENVRELSPDIIVVIAFKILPESLYSIPTHGAMNVHASLLPKYRGAAPINHAIMNGDKETGLTAFLLKSTVDTGDIVVQERTAIGENETFGELYTRLSEASGRFLLKALDTVHTGGPFTRQDDSQATKAPKIFPADTFIQFTQSAEQVRNFVRGLSPFPGATTEFRGSQIKIVSCTHASIAQTEPKQPGMLDTQRNRLFVNCGDAPLEILQVKPSGKGTMDGSAFINGFQPRPEERFGAASPTLKESR